MARITLFAAANSDAVSAAATQELVATFEAALAVCVADAASPTQAHVAAADAAYTALKVIWTKDFVVDYDRANISTLDLKRRAIRAIFGQMSNVG